MNEKYAKGIRCKFENILTFDHILPRFFKIFTY